MAAVSQATTTLLGGISQQPDPNKLPGQVREAVNVQLNPTFGCEKRPATKFTKVLANDIPSGVDRVKWFDIFRDTVEKYVACIYRKSGSTRLRVWDCQTGDERTVTINPASQDYLDANDPTIYRHLTISDYTLITNPEQTVTINSAAIVEQNDVALAVVNQIAYNTTYNINFLKDGQETTPVKIYSASTLSVRPATFTEFDEGACSKAANQQYVEEQGDKTGLSFDLTTICQPTQFPVRLPNDSYPTSMVLMAGDVQRVAEDYLGKAKQYGNGSYAYLTEKCYGTSSSFGSVTIRIEFRTSGVKYDDEGKPKNDGDWNYSGNSIVAYEPGIDYAVGMRFLYPAGLDFDIQDIQTPDDTIEYDFKSVYRSSVRLRNGGVNWRVGDEVTVTMAGKQYIVTVETETFGYGFQSEASVSYTTQSTTDTGGSLDVADIVGALTTEINALDNYKAEPIGNVIHIERTDGKKFNIQAVGGTTERAIYAIKGTVNDVSLLPIQGKDGTILLVRNTVDSTADDYYVRFTTAEGDIPGQGSWEETVKPGIPTTMNPTSLPQALIRKANGSFVLRPLSPSLDITPDKVGSWVGREVGDTESNPSPSFVGKGIANMFFFMNRLGFLSEDAVIMSQPGSYFNFFVGSAIAVSDADPIDMVAASEQPSFLKAAIGVPRGALLFAENSQYILSTQEVAFGPSTAKITKISDYSYDSKIQPLETGISLMFHTESATYSKVFEMAIPSADQARPQVAEITRIIPEYIPPTLNWSSSNPNNGQVFFGQGDKVAYNFSFFNVANERSMSGWTKWVFNYDISHLAYFQDRAYIVQYNAHTSSYFLSTMDVLDNPGDSTITAAGREFTPRLDALIPKSKCSLVAINSKQTEVTIPEGLTVYDDLTDTYKPITILFGNLGNATFFQEAELVDSKFIIPTKDALRNFDVGFSYDMKVVLPSFYVMSGDKTADRNNVPIIETVLTYLYLSGSYQAKLSRLGYQDRFVDLEVVRADVYLADSNPISEVGVAEIPLYCKGDLATVEITSNSPLPASITGYGWEGHYSNRGIKNLRR